MESLDQVARASGLNPKRLNTILKNVNERRGLHRLAKKGWSMKEKNSPWLCEAIIPFRVFLHFRETYFNDSQDEVEKAKSMSEFLRLYPQFKARD